MSFAVDDSGDGTFDMGCSHAFDIERVILAWLSIENSGELHLDSRSCLFQVVFLICEHYQKTSYLFAILDCL